MDTGPPPAPPRTPSPETEADGEEEASTETREGMKKETERRWWSSEKSPEKMKLPEKSSEWW